MSWGKKQFEDLFEMPLKNGLTRPSRVRGSGIKMINMGELFAHDRIDGIDMELVPVNERELETMLVEEGDLLFARQSLVLAGAGKCSIVSTALEPITFESHIIRVRLKKQEANPNFFYYYFKSPACGIRSIVTQGVQAGIRGSDLRRLSVSVPPLAVQRAIAMILSVHDDLVANNWRRIELLEWSVRLLFKEWFVRLRYPGHEHDKIVDGVPAGWTRRALGDVADISWGDTSTTKASYIADGFDAYSATGLDGKLDHYDFDRVGIVLSAIGAQCGKMWLARGKWSCIKNTIRLWAKEDSVTTEYLFFATAEPEFWPRRGGAQPFISQGDAQRKTILVPPKALMTDFTSMATKNLEQADLLKTMNEKVTKARDLLLPRLMDGRIAV